jgi:integrase
MDLAPWLDATSAGAAADWFKAAKSFFGWLVDSGRLASDPMIGLKPPKQLNQGHHSWSEAQIEQFQGRWPLGTVDRLMLELLVNTAQRRSDVARMGPQQLQLRDGRKVIEIVQQKTKQEVSIPITAELAEALAVTPVTGVETFLATDTGRPFSAPGCGVRLAHACDAAGLPEICRAHGLRKAACRRLAEAGCTAFELMSISGHQSRKDGRSGSCGGNPS